MKFKNLPKPLSPARAARRNQHVANFRAGQAAYNQLLTNLRNIEGLKELRHQIVKQSEKIGALQQALHYRMITYPPNLRGPELRKFQRLQALQNQNGQIYMNAQTRIREAKRRVLNIIPPRFRPPGHHTVPYNVHVLNQWEPTLFIGALGLIPGGKISKAGLNYTTRPHGKTSVNLFARSNANIAGLLKRKRSSPRRNAGQ
jgi:hypothetical protein